MYHIFLGRLSIDGHLGWLQYLIIRNSTAINMDKYCVLTWCTQTQTVILRNFIMDVRIHMSPGPLPTALSAFIVICCLSFIYLILCVWVFCLCVCLYLVPVEARCQTLQNYSCELPSVHFSNS